jgi:hypothetical protein
MKRYILILVIALIPLAVVCQTASKVLEVENYCFAERSPVKITMGDTIIVSCDSLYLMNPKRYAFYKDLHNAVLSGDDYTYAQLLTAYELRIQEHQQIIDKLLLNSKLAEDITFSMIDSTQSSIASTQETITNSQSMLDKSALKLDEAKGDIKKGKLGSSGKKFLYGAGGFGTGLILGIILMK